MPTTLVWFRRDLRLRDNPALRAACRRGAVVPIFVYDPQAEDLPGGASRWWLEASLRTLADALRAKGSRLILRRGEPATTLGDCARKIGAEVFWSRRYEPAAVRREEQVRESLDAAGVEMRSFAGHLLAEPWTVETKAGTPYQVFTPFAKNFRQLDIRPPLPLPREIPAPKSWPESETFADLGIAPSHPWTHKLAASWTPGEAAAANRLNAFLRHRIEAYPVDRDVPAEDGTSRLSPHLHFGEIGPHQVWHRVSAYRDGHPASGAAAESFLRQLLWREFTHHVLYHFPHSLEQPLKPQYARFPWREDEESLHAWRRGRTGYPLVDAGMRELWATGWMHNRARMAVASFLVKHLLLPWTAGAAWFTDTLVDADTAQNTFNWQWAAGCGADAVPYFRIFNPVLQGRKFDKRGVYIHQWVPEIAALPDKWLHAPWQAPAKVLQDSGLRLGPDYPEPLVKHEDARARALRALKSVKSPRRGAPS